LRQAGWVFVGYNFRRGDTIAIDENSEVAKQMEMAQRINNPPGSYRETIRATFKREYQ